MHATPRWGSQYLGLIRALVALLTGCLASPAAAGAGLGRFRYDYQALSGGQTGLAAAFFKDSEGIALAATDPRTGQRVRITIPDFEELLIDGGSLTFTFGPLPGQKRRSVLKLRDVTLPDVLMEKPALCEGSRPLKLVRAKTRFSCPPHPEDLQGGGAENHCLMAWQSGTWSRCASRFGFEPENRSIPESLPRVHWMEAAGITFDWRDGPTVAVYCHFQDDPWCAGRFDEGLGRGKPTLLWAVKRNVPEVITALARAGADFNSRALAGREALFLAIRARRPALIPPMLEGGLNVRGLREGAGEIPLTLAVRYGQVETVQALLDAGADIQEKDGFGSTAREVAAEEGHTRIVELLDARARQGARKGKR